MKGFEMTVLIISLLVILRALFIRLATHSYNFRYHSKICDADVTAFCWMVLIPLMGDAIMAMSTLICLITYLNDMFEVKK